VAASPSTSAPPAQEWARNTMAGKLSKGDKLGVVDHSKINYAPFRRSFYIEVPELARMSAADVAAYRRQLDDIKARAVSACMPAPPDVACGSASCCLTSAASRTGALAARREAAAPATAPGESDVMQCTSRSAACLQSPASGMCGAPGPP